MKAIAAVLLVAAAAMQPALAQSALDFGTSSMSYSPGQPLLVYGETVPNDPLIIRLFAPDGSIKAFEQVLSDKTSGAFSHVLLVWPEPSVSFPFGTYGIEIISTARDDPSGKKEIRFGPAGDADQQIDRAINTVVYAPETAAVNSTVRVFVQTTSDGLLIGDSASELLASTHVHLPGDRVRDISGDFVTLHRGLHYVDYSPEELGTYVFHAVTFYEGLVSHGSAAAVVLGQDIGGISDQILSLDSVLHDTSLELDHLRSEVYEFGSTLEKADTNIDANVRAMSESVANIEEASLQLNSLLFPIVASIGIIVALQIAILARHR